MTDIRQRPCKMCHGTGAGVDYLGRGPSCGYCHGTGRVRSPETLEERWRWELKRWNCKMSESSDTAQLLLDTMKLARRVGYRVTRYASRDCANGWWHTWAAFPEGPRPHWAKSLPKGSCVARLKQMYVGHSKESEAYQKLLQVRKWLEAKSHGKGV